MRGCLSALLTVETAASVSSEVASISLALASVTARTSWAPRVKIHCGEHGMDEGAKAASAGALSVRASNLFELNARQSRVGEICAGSQCGDCLNFDRGAARFFNRCQAALFPLGVSLFALSHFGTTLVCLQDPLLPQANILFDVEP